MSSNPITAALLTLAKKVNNYEIDPVTGVKVLWTDTTHYRATVPSGKRWFLQGGVIKRNVSGTLSGALYDSSDNVIALLTEEGAATGITIYPEAAYFIGTPWTLDAGEYFEVLFGIAQDAGSFVSCVVLEVDV